MKFSCIIKKKLHSSNDCIFGKLLEGVARKCMPNEEFVRLKGPASCFVKKECSEDRKKLIRSDPEFRGFKLNDEEYCGFDMKEYLVCEPSCGYSGRDHKGSKKHSKKAYGHTPDERFNVEENYIPAICYIAKNRQKRRPEIKKTEVSLVRGFKKTH